MNFWKSQGSQVPKLTALAVPTISSFSLTVATLFPFGLAIIYFSLRLGTRPVPLRSPFSISSIFSLITASLYNSRSECTPLCVSAPVAHVNSVSYLKTRITSFQKLLPMLAETQSNWPSCPITGSNPGILMQSLPASSSIASNITYSFILALPFFFRSFPKQDINEPVHKKDLTRIGLSIAITAPCPRQKPESIYSHNNYVLCPRNWSFLRTTF